MVSVGGVEIIQKFITTCPTEKKFDNILNSAINVFLKCVIKGELPVSSSKGAITFRIPTDDGTTFYDIGKGWLCYY